MTTRKRTTKRTTTLRNSAKPTTKRARRTAISSRKKGNTDNVANFLVPFVFLVAILAGLGFLLFKGYQTVTASSFFDVKKIEVRGTLRVSKDEIEKIVRSQTERKGVWNAELDQIKADVEKLNFVKSAVVSRVLPDGILVKVDERVPRAVVKTNSGDFWVDDDAMIVAKAEKNDNRPPFILRGWDEAKSEKAQKDNKERVKVFLKALEEFKGLGIEKTVNTLNVIDLQDIKVIVEDSGETISVKLGKEDFGKRLQRALPFAEGKGAEIEELTSYGGYVSATPRKRQTNGG